MCESVSLSICGFVLLLWLFFFCCFVLSYFHLFAFYFILLCYLSLDTCMFSKIDTKRMDLDGRGGKTIIRI